jgi:hypothetical protein
MVPFVKEKCAGFLMRKEIEQLGKLVLVDRTRPYMLEKYPLSTKAANLRPDTPQFDQVNTFR